MDKEKRSEITLIGHIKRCLDIDVPLKDNILAKALEIIENQRNNLHGDNVVEFVDGIVNKLITGKKLSDYEYEIFVEVLTIGYKIQHEL
ncbi:hypothetical protein [Bacteroides ovatus]|jgi:hypothetical protein|uniref:hypothetical protein n=1 Tax=Bacteroides ovatus TaxID=28116 RepID=UPI002059876C|nr:hypothetical protein [Bacteroides ovatus]UYI64238.1 MAG: hypothetical protein OGM04_02155 [Bacteroides ovatus]DAU81456.1 MAG TPA: hypothetical protein [Caudoviricetes sp.]